MTRPLRLCVLGCSASSTGELTLALEWLKRCKRPMELHGIVPRTAAKQLRSLGATAHPYPALAAKVALHSISQSLQDVAADVVLIADLLLCNGPLGEFGGLLGPLLSTLPARTSLLGLDLYDWDRNHNAVDLLGHTPRLPPVASNVGRLMPSPYLPPAASTPGRGRYAMLEHHGRLSRRQKEDAKASLGLGNRPVMLWTTSPWQHLAQRHPASRALAQQGPAVFFNVMEEAAQQVDGATLLHLGPTSLQPGALRHLEYRHISQLPPAQYLNVMRAADVMFTPNAIATSAMRAASLGIPVAVFHVDDAALGYPCSVWPLGMHTLVDRLWADNPLAQTQLRLSSSNVPRAVAALAALMGGGPTARELQAAQEAYFRMVDETLGTADDALDAALAVTPHARKQKPRKLEPARATWESGTRYFWDARVMTGVLRHKAARPGVGTDFWDIWMRCAPYSLCDPWRAQNIHARMLEVAHLDGDIVECGTWQGGISLMLALTCQRLGLRKKVHALDSFQGLPSPRAGVDLFHHAGWCAATLDSMKSAVQRMGLEDRIIIHPGWFQDTLPQLEGKRFCLAHLDGDLYASTKECVEFIAPRMEPGGVVLVDDYHDSGEGVKRAVDEHVRSTGEKLHAGPVPQVYFRSGVLGGNGTASLDELRANKPYQAMLRLVARAAQRDARALEDMHRRLG